MPINAINIAVIQFPGSNCERETKMAIERAGMHACDFFWNDSNVDLAIFDGYVIIGGFSYEDRGRSGLIAAKDPVMQKLKVEAAKGKPVIGICNGAQILVESGLVPGAEDGQLAMALTLNKRVKDGEVLGTGFYNDWCWVKPMQKAGVFDSLFDQPMHIPLAHAEGRFVMTKNVLEALKTSGASLWQYTDESGKVDHHFPINPNGSVENLAAVSNAAGNVLAIMPHPERTAAGDVIFQSIYNYIVAKKPVNMQPLTVEVSPAELQPAKPESGYELLVKTIIADNEAVSVNKAVQKMGFDVEIERYTHWQVDAEEATKQAVSESYELFNPSKESLVNKLATDSFHVLVRHDFDSVGQHKLENLQKQCVIDVKGLKAGTVWRVKTQDRELLDSLLAENIFANPVADVQELLS